MARIIRDHPGDLIVGFGILTVVVAGYIWASMNWERLPAWGMVLPALAFTLLLFGFGWYLMVRADQRRGGETLWLGTLLLVPINGMILGELTGGRIWQPANLLVTLAGVLVIGYLTAIVAGHHERQGLRLFAGPYLALALAHLLLDRERGLSLLGHQVMLAAATAVLLGGVVRVNLKLDSPTRIGKRQFLVGGLGFLLYAYALLALRLQVWFQPLSAAHYAPHCALAALAVFHTGHCSPRLFDEPRMSALVPCGYGLFGFALALALINPTSAPVAVLLTALILVAGTGLLVHWTGQPFHLWASFVAVTLVWYAWPPVFPALAVRLEAVFANLFGYPPGELPMAFTGIRLLAPIALLLLGTLHFQRREAPQLRLPCQLTAAGLAVVALAISVSVPAAMALTWLGLAVLLAASGLIWQESRLVGGAAVAASGGGAAAVVTVGFGLREASVLLAGLVLVWLRVADRLGARNRVGDGEAVQAAAALVAVAAAVLGAPGTPTESAAAWALLAVAGLWAAWTAREAAASYLGAAAAMISVGIATGTWWHPGADRILMPWLLLTAGLALAGAASLRFRGERGILAELYGWPLSRGGLVAAAVVTALAGVPPFEFGTVLALGGVSLIVGREVRRYGHPDLTHWTALTAVAAVALGARRVGLVPESLAVQGAWLQGLGILLYALAALDLWRARGTERVEQELRLIGRPLAADAVILTFPALALATVGGEPLGLAINLALLGLIYGLALGVYPGPAPASLSLLAFVVAAGELLTMAGWGRDFASAAVATSAAAMTLWVFSRSCDHRQRRPDDRAACYQLPAAIFAVTLSAAAVAFCAGVAVVEPEMRRQAIGCLLAMGGLQTWAANVWRSPDLFRIALLVVTAALLWAISPFDALRFGSSAPASLALASAAAVAWMAAYRHEAEEWRRLFGEPLYEAALLLAVGGLVLGYALPPALIVLALVSLLPLWSHPSRHWLYVTVALTAAATWQWTPAATRQPLWPATAALLAWAAGMVIRRNETELSAPLRLDDDAYHEPFLVAALFAATGATGWLIAEIGFAEAWLRPQPWLATLLALGLYWLLQIAWQPSPHWLYGTALCWGYALFAVTLAALGRWQAGWLAAVLAPATVGLMAASGLRRYGGRLPLPADDYHAPFEVLSLLANGLLAALLVWLSLSSAALGDAEPPLAMLGVRWSDALAAFVVIGLNLGTVYRAQPKPAFLALGLLYGLAGWCWLLSASAWQVPFTAAAAGYALLLAVVASFPDGLESLHHEWVRAGVEWDDEALRRVVESAIVVAGVFAVAISQGRLVPGTIVAWLLLAGAAAVRAVVLREQRAAAATFVAGLSGQIGLLYLLVLLALSPAGGGGDGAPAEIASFAALFCAVPMFGLLVLSEGLSRWLGLAGEPWLRPLRWVMRLQAVLTATAVAASWVGLGYPPALIHIRLCAISLALLATFCFWLAWHLDDEAPVYFGGLALAALWFYGRFAVGLDYRFDAWVMFAMALATMALRQMTAQRGPFSRPLLLTSLLLPALPLALIWLEGYTPDDRIGLVLITGLYYAGIWRQSSQAWAGIVAATLIEFALCLHWLRHDLAIASHLQYYLMPGALLALLVAQVHAEELGREQLSRIRWIATALLYAAPFSDLFAAKLAIGQWCLVMVFATTGLLVGRLFRIAPFFYLGGALLLGNTATLLTDTVVSSPGWRVLTLVGVGLVLIGCGAYWSRLRDWWDETAALMSA